MRIVIYSRKSKWTGKGESVENQVTMCREYISQFIEGSAKAEILVYEDEGFSGKNTKRPKFQEMMLEIRKEKVDYLVCYRLDRLGRNLADLASLMETLEKLNISFISIKEKFDTSTPIGKAMLLFSGVLAQMEREQIAERVRDNMAMLARDGRWLGGNAPLGFCSERLDKASEGGKKKSLYRLCIREDEIVLVQKIFNEFLKCQSLNGVLSCMQVEDRKTRNGREFAITAIRDILTNPVYCTADLTVYRYYCDLGCQVCIDKEELDGITGLMSYAKTSSGRYKNKPTKPEEWIISKGRHKGIISGKDFVKVQRLLSKNKVKGENFKRTQNQVSLLSGLIFCKCGHSMRPKNYPSTRLTEKGERTFAYLCMYKDQTKGEKCSTSNIHGNTLDNMVCNELLECVKPDAGIIPLLEELKNELLKADSYKIDEQESLIKEKEKKQRQIQKLIASISNAQEGAAAKYILEQIDLLDGDCKQIDKKLKETETNGEEGRAEEKQIQAIVKRYSDFYQMFPDLSVVEKREFLSSIVQKVIWDGEIAHIYLRPPASEEKVSISIPSHYHTR